MNVSQNELNESSLSRNGDKLQQSLSNNLHKNKPQEKENRDMSSERKKMIMTNPYQKKEFEKFEKDF